MIKWGKLCYNWLNNKQICGSRLVFLRSLEYCEEHLFERINNNELEDKAILFPFMFMQILNNQSNKEMELLIYQKYYERD